MHKPRRGNISCTYKNELDIHHYWCNVNNMLFRTLRPAVIGWERSHVLRSRKRVSIFIAVSTKEHFSSSVVGVEQQCIGYIMTTSALVCVFLVILFTSVTNNTFQVTEGFPTKRRKRVQW